MTSSLSKTSSVVPSPRTLERARGRHGPSRRSAKGSSMTSHPVHPDESTFNSRRSVRAVSLGARPPSTHSREELWTVGRHVGPTSATHLSCFSKTSTRVSCSSVRVVPLPKRWVSPGGGSLHGEPPAEAGSVTWRRPLGPLPSPDAEPLTSRRLFVESALSGELPRSIWPSSFPPGPA